MLEPRIVLGTACPAIVAVFTIFKADTSAIQIGDAIGVSAVSIGFESRTVGKIEHAQRFDPPSDIRCGCILHESRLRRGQKDFYIREQKSISPLYIPLNESSLLRWKVILALIFSSISLVFKGVMPMAISVPQLRMEPMLASKVL